MLEQINEIISELGISVGNWNLREKVRIAADAVGMELTCFGTGSEG